MARGALQGRIEIGTPLFFRERMFEVSLFILTLQGEGASGEVVGQTHRSP